MNGKSDKGIIRADPRSLFVVGAVLKYLNMYNIFQIMFGQWVVSPVLPNLFRFMGVWRLENRNDCLDRWCEKA